MLNQFKTFCRMYIRDKKDSDCMLATIASLIDNVK